MYAYDRKKEQDITEKKGGRARKKEDSIQRKSSRADPAARAQNRTGIPTQLKERMEYHTGLSLDDVRVHYHSDMPKRLDALAYTQGNQVYLGAGQERHLPHELGHVVQQKLGKVQPDTRHESGALMNTDAALEREADEIGALRKTAGGSGGNAGTVQRRIDPESDALDDGALIGAVRARMKKYKPAYENEIRNFYRLIKRSSYPFTNDEILERILDENWNKEGTAERLFSMMEGEKQEELDLRYGGKRGHMVSRHIEISDEELRGRVKGKRAIARASRFAPTVKGKDQALHTLERLQPVLETLLRGVMQMAGNVLVQEMPQISTMRRIGQIKTYLKQMYAIDFDTDIEETEGEFDITYKLLLQGDNLGKADVSFTLSTDYSVQVDRTFQKQVVEKGRTGKVKRVYETAEVHRGRNKPSIQVTPVTTADEIDELVEESGINIVGVTFY